MTQVSALDACDSDSQRRGLEIRAPPKATKATMGYCIWDPEGKRPAAIELTISPTAPVSALEAACAKAQEASARAAEAARKAKAEKAQEWKGTLARICIGGFGLRRALPIRPPRAPVHANARGQQCGIMSFPV